MYGIFDKLSDRQLLKKVSASCESIRVTLINHMSSSAFLFYMSWNDKKTNGRNKAIEQDRYVNLSI
jgi:hypothetical protein